MTEQNQNRRVIEVSYEASAYTNVYRYSLLFSIKSKKFVKPILEKHLKVWYRILEGTYLRLHSAGRRTIDVQDVLVELVKIGEKEEVLKAWSWQVFMTPGWTEGCPKIIVDFVTGRPGYHSYPSIDYTKIYTEEDIKAVMQDGICGQPEE